MQVTDLIEQLRQKGVALKVEGHKLRFYPQSAMTPELLAVLRDYKQQVMVYLIHEQRDSPVLFHNPAYCHNPFTPHAAHELPWECDPDSCHCYHLYGYPRFCSGAPCRWIWPTNIPEEKIK